jgi:tripartite-type tricarboxylate transporter receptor subunit TctC
MMFSGIIGRSLRRTLASGVCLLVSAGVGASASAQEFYAGRTIVIIAGFPPGGGVDTGARLNARHLSRFIPGKPNVVVQNMPGAAGVMAADYLYSSAPRDGSTLGMPGRDWPLVPVLDQRGGRYDPLAFEFIGSTGAANTFLWLNRSVGVSTVAGLKESSRTIVFGGLTPDTHPSMTPKILALNGFPVKAVSGYRGTAEIVQALEKGEIDGVVTTVSTFARRPDMMQKVVRVMKTQPSYDAIPLVTDFVTEDSKALLKLTGYASLTGLMLVAPPKTPQPQLSVLRQAFDRMVRDSAFATDAEKLGEPFGEPVDGARIRAILRDTIASATPDVLAAYRKLSSVSH